MDGGEGPEDVVQDGYDYQVGKIVGVCNGATEWRASKWRQADMDDDRKTEDRRQKR